MQCSPPRVTRSRPQVPGSPNARSRLADRSPQVGPRGQVRNDLTVLPSTSYWRAAGTRACVRAQESVLFCLERRSGRQGRTSRLLGEKSPSAFHHSAVTETPPPLRSSLPLPRSLLVEI